MPICGVNKGLARRNRRIAVNQNAKMMIILKDSTMNMGRFIGAATNRSKI
jgi:hypothetical protein